MAYMFSGDRYCKWSLITDSLSAGPRQINDGFGAYNHWTCRDGHSGDPAQGSTMPVPTEAGAVDSTVAPQGATSVLIRSGTSLGVAAGVGVIVAVAAPLVVTGVVGALGFEVGGVVAGSAAASMMSAEAVASGGAVAAGGLVATLQSIGAAGLGVGGTVAAAGTGATVGSAVGGGAASAVARSSGVAASGIGGFDARGTWTVVVEEWFGKGCRTHQFQSAQLACDFFDDKWRCARILVNPIGTEVAHGIFLANVNGALERVRHHWRAQHNRARA
eukprot:CAMPEP_0180702368 /NCGR_PEP_ID=MMETSP1038_2-20121128/6083_1 /TAXON_ID=632150 /ORGANISM="Azadinium spinosum, Strain 3D9" /LENGTH=273 /DNA_ID=CAMNT_0022734125 /DNA_START=422 /DNA_END=1240 /DNA_ORIENTATION=-